ncbi:MAG: cadherin-like beta sandwich domain-containing protein [Oscillospiraceae bacterium]|nr:cadherin-like beta sandwich domain-containing protein [Oscillospiraceae bacterium]
MKKTFSLLLVLALLLCLIPMGASAAEDWAWRLITRDTTEYHFEDGTYVIYDNSKDWILESTNPDYKVQVTDQYNPGDSDSVITNYTLHDHDYGWEISREGHYLACFCGLRKGDIIPHDEIKDAVDGRCVCGYKYMDDATLCVLWISGVKLDNAFDPDTTEYKATLLSKDTEAVNISAFTNDANADLEVSGDMILKSGTNTITLKVTSETGTENTYTVTIEK